MLVNAWKYALIGGVLFLTGCASHRSLVVHDQGVLIKRHNTVLQRYGEFVQQEIKASKTIGALVISDPNSDQRPLVYPAQDPIAAAMDHIPALKTDATCFFVFARSIAIAPEATSCGLLMGRATELQESRRIRAAQQEALEKFETDLKELQKNVNVLRDQTSTLANQLGDERRLQQEDRNNITSDRADINSIGKILGPMTSLVTFHETQLQGLEKMTDRLIAQYQKTGDAIGVNNNQIDAVIKDINTSFAGIKVILEQIQQRLSTIK